MWVIKKEEGRNQQLYTVGFFTPAGDWVDYQVFENGIAAEEKCNYLNGGAGEMVEATLESSSEN